MSGYGNMGSTAFWVSVLILAAIGVISAIVWIVKGVIWIYNHVTIS